MLSSLFLGSNVLYIRCQARLKCGDLAGAQADVEAVLATNPANANAKRRLLGIKDALLLRRLEATQLETGFHRRYADVLSEAARLKKLVDISEKQLKAAKFKSESENTHSATLEKVVLIAKSIGFSECSFHKFGVQIRILV